MDLRINRESEVPIRDQLREQIIFLVATTQLKPEEKLPSVRGLARRLGIHPNTVSRAYGELVERGWLIRHRGARLVVRSEREDKSLKQPENLDDLIDEILEKSRSLGYAPQDLKQRFQERMAVPPPRSLLVVGQERALRHLLRAELKEELSMAIETCSLESLKSLGEIPGVLAAATPGSYPGVRSHIDKTCQVVRLEMSPYEEHVKLIHNLGKSAVIGVASISKQFLDIARGVLAPVVGDRHTLRTFFLPQEPPRSLKAIDLIFCDSLVFQQLKLSHPGDHSRLVLYRALAPACLEEISGLLNPSRLDSTGVSD